MKLQTLKNRSFLPSYMKTTMIQMEKASPAAELDIEAVGYAMQDGLCIVTRIVYWNIDDNDYRKIADVAEFLLPEASAIKIFQANKPEYFEQFLNNNPNKTVSWP